MRRLSIYICLLFAMTVTGQTDVFRKAIQTAYNTGTAESQYKVASLYWKGGETPFETDDYIHWLTLAARQGHRQAMTDLASRYTTGILGNYVIILNPNYREALVWWEKVQDYFMMSKIYAQGGYGVQKDVSKALENAEKAANKNGGLAFFVAEMYEAKTVSDKVTNDIKTWYNALRGSVTVNKTKSFRFYKINADQTNNDYSCVTVAEKYLKGEGVTQNIPAAKVYFEKAGRDGLVREAMLFAFGSNPRSNPYIGKNLSEKDVTYIQGFAVQPDFKTAHEAVDKAILLDKNKPASLAHDYNLKGVIYMAQGNEYEALRMYGKVLDLNSRYFKENESALHIALFSNQ